MQRVLLVGTSIASTKAQNDKLIAQMQEHMPDRKVLIVPGLLWASEHEVNEIVEASRPDPGRPEKVTRKKFAQPEG